MSFASLNPLSVSDFLPDTAKVQDLGNKFHNTRQIVARSKPEYIVTTVKQLNRLISNLHELIQFAEDNAPASSVSFTSFAIRTVESIVGIAASDTTNTIGKVIDKLISNYHISYGKVIDEVVGQMSSFGHLMDETVEHLIKRKGNFINDSDMKTIMDIALSFSDDDDLENAVQAINSLVVSLELFIKKTEDDDQRMKYHREHLNFMPRRIYIDPPHAIICRQTEEDLLSYAKNFTIEVGKLNKSNNSKLTQRKMNTFTNLYYNFTLSAGTVDSCMQGYYHMLLEIKHWLKEDDYVNRRTNLITSDLRTSYSVEELSKDLKDQLLVFQQWANLYAKSELTQSQMADKVDSVLQAKVMF